MRSLPIAPYALARSLADACGSWMVRVRDASHSRAEHVSPAIGSHQPEPDPVLALADVVEQQAKRTARVGDDDVDIAVVVDVAERRTATHVGDAERGTGPVRDLLETSAAQIPEQLGPLLQRERLAPCDRVDVLRDSSVDGEQIEPAVVVEIKPGSAEAG